MIQHPLSPPMKWDSKPDHQPCWSIWAPVKQPSAPSPFTNPHQVAHFQRLTPPKESESRFWPLQKPQVHSQLPHSPPLTPVTSPYMAPLVADRSYLINCQGPLYIVQFKGDRLEVYTGAANVEHYENELVIVEADRGQDLGRIFKANVDYDFAGQLKLKQHEERTAVLNACGSKEPPTTAAPYTPNNILRSATNAEINQLSQKLADERKAVALCCQKVRERNLDMAVVDSEFQWDRRKLTFFYKAGHRIDFRDLVRELFRTYKTRIWMCAVASE